MGRGRGDGEGKGEGGRGGLYVLVFNPDRQAVCLSAVNAVLKQFLDHNSLFSVKAMSFFLCNTCSVVVFKFALFDCLLNFVCSCVCFGFTFSFVLF